MRGESQRTGFAKPLSPSLFSGTIPTFLGLALPLVLGAFSVPYIIQKLGVERFGVLTLIWAVVGYFSLFDFGISRALTKRIAELGSESKAQVLGSAIRVALFLLFALGVIAGGLTWIAYGLAIKLGYLHQSREAFLSMLYLAIGMPLLLVGLGLRGVLEGKQRFGPPNWSRVLLGVMTFGVPIPLLNYFPSMDVLVAALVFGRFLMVLLQGHACLNELRLAASARTDRGELMALLRFGGWMTVSNLVSPVMVYMDRFIVGASPYAPLLAFYTAPFEAVTRLLIVPGAITTALFPKLVELHAESDSSASEAMFKGMAVTLLFLVPLVIFLQFFSSELLRLWLGDAFARHGSLPMQLIAWGILFNAMAQFPFAFLQSAGRPDWIAKLHMLEMPLYLAMLFLGLDNWGIAGVAAAWLVRTAMDLLLLSVMSLIIAKRSIARHMLFMYAAAFVVGGLWMVTLFSNVDIAVRLLLCLTVSGGVSWHLFRLVKPASQIEIFNK